MTHWFRKARPYRRVMGLALCSSLLVSTAALARFRPTPTAPRGRIPPLGTRGCSTQKATDFTALAPISTIADLTVEQPTIAWYVPDQESYPITLKLYQDVATGAAMPEWELKREFKLDSTQGIMTAELPTELLAEGSYSVFTRFN